MTTQDRDLGADDELEAFLDGRGDLARRLQAMPQPEPPASLDAAILARVRADLAAGAAQPDGQAANDATLPGRGHPGFLARWRMPLALAASLLVGLFLLLQWQPPGGPAPSVVARAPQARPPEGTGATVAAKPSAAASPRSPGTLTPTPAPDGTAVAALETARPDLADASPSMPAATPIAPAAATPIAPAATPAAAAPAPAAAAGVDSERAQTWLALIEELLKAGLHQDALAEWRKFRAAYPDYPAPEELAARIESLQKR